MVQFTIQEAFDLAWQQHQAGRLADATLSQQRDHVDAIHDLCVLAHQMGRDDLAVELIGQFDILVDPALDSAANRLFQNCPAGEDDSSLPFEQASFRAFDPGRRSTFAPAWWL